MERDQIKGSVAFWMMPADLWFSLLVLVWAKFWGYIYSTNFFCSLRFVFWTFHDFAKKGYFLEVLSFRRRQDRQSDVVHDKSASWRWRKLALSQTKYITTSSEWSLRVRKTLNSEIHLPFDFELKMIILWCPWFMSGVRNKIAPWELKISEWLTVNENPTRSHVVRSFHQEKWDGSFQIKM